MSLSITRFLSRSTGTFQFMARVIGRDGIVYAGGIYASREAATADRARLIARAEAERAAA